MDDRVIPDVMNEVLLPQGIYPENFVLGLLTGDRDDRVIPDVMNDALLP